MSEAKKIRVVIIQNSITHDLEYNLKNLIKKINSIKVGNKKTIIVNHELSYLRYFPITKNTIYKIIRPCGLAPQKSKAIFELSRILVKQFNGKVPESFEELEKLPGVGHKTASVVMSQAFGVPAFPVDTHIQRLMYRWGFSNGKSVVQTERDAKRLFPKDLWNKLHLQIIFYGREYSPARGWDLEKDIITSTVGRRSEIQRWYKEQELKHKKDSTRKKARG